MKTKIKLIIVIFTIPLIIFLGIRAKNHYRDVVNLVPDPIPDGVFKETVVTYIDMSDEMKHNSVEYDFRPNEISVDLGYDDENYYVSFHLKDDGDRIKYYFMRTDADGKGYTGGIKYKKKTELWPYIIGDLIYVAAAESVDFSGNIAHINLKATKSSRSGTLVLMILIIIAIDLYVLFRKRQD